MARAARLERPGRGDTPVATGVARSPAATSRRGTSIAVAGLVCAAIGGCELEEVTVAESVDVIVAEVVLRAGDATQAAVLHRTARLPGTGAAVPGAQIRVSAEGGPDIEYVEAPVVDCFRTEEDDADSPPPVAETDASCYVAVLDDPGTLAEGERYTLEILVPDGRRLVGTTTVPGPFEVRSPESSPCTLPPDTRLPLTWSPAAGAWAYIAEARFEGLRDALAGEGVEVPEDPLTLLAVAVGQSDTTLALPAGFGVFDRFDADLLPTLVALQRGLPSGVSVDVHVAAADRNFVNWVRGGNFNPSGNVQQPSIFGDGTGLFGSMTLRHRHITTRSDGSDLAPCTD